VGGAASGDEIGDEDAVGGGGSFLQRLGTVRVGETPVEQFELDKQVEESAIDMYRRGVQLALDEGDPGTRELLEHLVVGEEEHLDWIETQLHAIGDIGIERYLQSQLSN